MHFVAEETRFIFGEVSQEVAMVVVEFGTQVSRKTVDMATGESSLLCHCLCFQDLP